MMCPVSYDSTTNSSSAKIDGSRGGGSGRKIKYDLLNKSNSVRRPFEYDEEEGPSMEDEEEEAAGRSTPMKTAKSFIPSSSSPGAGIPRAGVEAIGGRGGGGGGGCKLMDMYGLVAVDSSERAEVTTKLSRAIAICVVFMVLETVGGVIAGSLAVLADALHMLSDVAGFAISLLALRASAWEPTPQQTFGYLRLEVLGALLSVQIIWVMTGIVVYEAVQRMLSFHGGSSSSVRVVKGRLVFLVACVGLVFNCVVIYVLGHHHHHHHHDHRHHHQHHHHSRHRLDDQNRHYDSAEDDQSVLLNGEQQRSDEHQDENLELEMDNAVDLEGGFGRKPTAFETCCDEGGGGGQDALFALKGKEKGMSGERNPPHISNAVELVGNFAKPRAGVTHQEQEQEEGEGEEVFEDDHETDGAEGCCSSSSEVRDGGGGFGGALNINLRGAYLHALGDLIQNLGVLITGVVIWVKPEWQLIDLLCSVVFSVVVVMTTLKMLKDIMWVLMEGSSRDLDVAMLKTGLQQISGVSAVTDLHVWALTPGTNLLSCHLEIRSGAIPREVLHDATEYCHNLHHIKHVTIQIEEVGAS